MTRVFIVDDHPLAREGLTAMLRDDETVDVVGEIGSGRQAVWMIEARRPDVVLLDLALPDMSGLDVLREVNRRCPATMVLVVSSSDAADDVRSLLDAGARGYVLKTCGRRQLLEAIATVARGGRSVAAEVARAARQPPPPLRPRLSDREAEVVRLVATGATNREIADVLDLSDESVKTYLSRACGKLGVRGRAAAVAAIAGTGDAPASGPRPPDGGP